MRSTGFFAVALIAFIAAQGNAAEPAPANDEMLSLTDAQQTLAQDFKQKPVWRRGATMVNAPIQPLTSPSFTWAPGYIWSHAPRGDTLEWPPTGRTAPAWTSNGADEADPNGDMIAKIGEERAPLLWKGPGRLELIASKMPDDLAATIGKTDPSHYLSAAISSFPYAQRYGIFAIRARLPKGAGIWPAFWLMPADKSWPPELDIMEVIGREASTLYTTVHWNGPQGATMQAHGTDTHADLSADFHEYAVDWGPKEIKWYFDRRLVFTQPTPEALHQPCYIVTNLAVGNSKSWGGAPDGTTHFPAIMTVESILAWQRPDYK